MIARVTLDIAVGRELDYAVPQDLRCRVHVGSRVRVPVGKRQCMGIVTALVDRSEHPSLKDLAAVVGDGGLLTPDLLRLGQWIANYYCCPVEHVLKSMLPEAVRKEDAGWKERLVVQALPAPDDPATLTPRQVELWAIIDEWRELPLQEFIRLGKTTAETLRRMEGKGWIRIAPQVEERDPYAREEIVPTQPLSLTPEQACALDRIVGSLRGGAPSPLGQGVDGSRGGPPTFLLHGVTGSGKTEVYLQAIEQALIRGQTAIVLVPEISLTPQTVERFKARFSGGRLRTLVAVLHSHLSSGERHDEWHKIRQGRARIVIGARSAVFAPVSRLGLIIVDEEHEHSYKQEEQPRYHARDVAVVRGRMEDAVVVLGSATPAMESYQNARSGKYQMVTLSQRVSEKRLPVVRVVDLRLEGKEGRKGGEGPGIFSIPLKEAIRRRLEVREQVILFLNRRGYASSIQCPACGHVVGCPNCSVSLTYHRSMESLLCHICGHRRPSPRICPEPACRSPKIRLAGMGTERVEETARKLFPAAVIARMDRDTLQKKEDYRRVLTEFRLGRIDILVGTQMIAKGLHFPRVTLVGVLNADLSLHVPDFRAGERTFQLLTQVSGRAGRGDVEGEVFVQSFTPFHPAIQYARRHDYEGFFEQEMEFRQSLEYPPITRIALLTFRGRSDDKVRMSAQHVRGLLEERLQGWTGTVVAGPAPAPLERAEGDHRFQIMVRTVHMVRLSGLLGGILAAEVMPKGVRWGVDIDPVNLV